MIMPVGVHPCSIWFAHFGKPFIVPDGHFRALTRPLSVVARFSTEPLAPRKLFLFLWPDSSTHNPSSPPASACLGHNVVGAHIYAESAEMADTALLGIAHSGPVVCWRRRPNNNPRAKSPSIFQFAFLSPRRP
jgi:hypothetical protein